MRELLRTTCNRDCPDACSIVATVEDGRAVRLQGDREDPVTRGFLCARTHRFLARQYAPDRFRTPMVRQDGRLVPLSWEAALDFAAEGLARIKRESGPAAILHYRSGGSLGILKGLADLLFERFGPVTVKRGDICSGAGEEAQIQDFGVSESSDLFDLLNSRLIVLWGKNPHISGPHLIPVLERAREAGALVVGIDPVRTRAAKLCDAFFQPRPGADYAVAMGIVRRLFEEGGADPEAGRYCEGLDAFRRLAFARSPEGWARAAGLDPAALAELAELYATRRPAAIQIGWGLARRRNGAKTVRAIDGLAAISGNLGVPGGGASYYYARRAAFDLGFLGGPDAAPRTLAEARLGEEILAARDPEIRAVWVTAGNPVSMIPDSGVTARALETRELVVAVDTHPTDTTDRAHLVLPTLTLLEDDDVLGAYGNHWLRVSRPAVEPEGEAWHELRILQGLAERLGLASVLEGTVRQWKERVLARLAGRGVTLERLEAGPVRSPFAARVLFEGRRFPTPSGKARLLAEPAALPESIGERPLRLLAVSVPEAQSSQWSLPIPDGPPEVRVHPDSAAGIPDGAQATLESARGRLDVRVRHDPAIHPEVAFMAKGGMLRDGRCANVLVTAEETDHGGGAVYYDQPVRLVAVS